MSLALTACLALSSLVLSAPAPSESLGPTPTLPATEAGGIYGQNPQLTAEWQVPGTSPGAGAGTAQASRTGDRLGNCYGSPPGIGAHEAP